MQKIALISSLLLITSISLVKGGVFEWFSLMWGVTVCVLISCYMTLSKSAAQDANSFISEKTIIAFLCFIAWTIIQLCLPSTNDIKTSTDSALLGFSFLGLLFVLKVTVKASDNLSLIHI